MFALKSTTDCFLLERALWLSFKLHAQKTELTIYTYLWSGILKLTFTDESKTILAITCQNPVLNVFENSI